MEFTVHYDDRVVRDAVNTFVKLRLLEGIGQLGLFALVLTTAGFVYLLWQGDRSWLVGVIGTVLVMILGIFILLWQWRHREMRRKLAAIPGRKGVITIGDEGLSVDTEAGGTTLPWASFTELWRLERCWLLFLAPNNFITVPTDGVPDAALAHLDAHLPQSCRRIEL